MPLPNTCNKDIWWILPHQDTHPNTSWKRQTCPSNGIKPESNTSGQLVTEKQQKFDNLKCYWVIRSRKMIRRTKHECEWLSFCANPAIDQPIVTYLSPYDNQIDSMTPHSPWPWIRMDGRGERLIKHKIFDPFHFIIFRTYIYRSEVRFGSSYLTLQPAGSLAQWYFRSSNCWKAEINHLMIQFCTNIMFKPN